SQGLLGDKLVELTLGSTSQPPVPDGGWIQGEPYADTTRLVGTATDALENARKVLARLDELTARVSASSAVDELEATARGLHRGVDAVEHGPGPAHELIYGGDLAADARRAVQTFGRAGDHLQATAERLDKLVAAVDPEKIRGATNDLASVAADVRGGKGTLG